MALDVSTLGVQFKYVTSDVWAPAKAQKNIFYRVENGSSYDLYLGNQLLSNQDNVDALSSAIETLVGQDANKSVRDIAIAVLTEQLVPADAQESLNTLEEIAAWIQDHPENVAAMNQQIQANKKGVEDNKAAIDKIVDGTTTVKNAEYATSAGSAGSATTAATASNAEKLGGELPSYYATASALSTGLAGKANASEVYKKTETYSQAEVDAELAKKADKATTLAGYGITDAYTETEVNNLLNNKADKATTYTKDDVNGLLNDKANKSDVYTTSQADAKFVETVTGKSGSVNGTIKLTVDGVDSADIAVQGLGTAAYQNVNAFATAAQGTKAETAVQSVTTSTTNGAIQVDGNDVAVGGLKSAAFHDASAFATSAQGAKADSAIQSVVSGSANGTIAVDGKDVAVKGLGSAAYQNTGAFATAAQGQLADSALQKADITTGTDAGTIKVDGTDVKVAGLGSAAYQNSNAFDAAGTAAGVQTALIGGDTDTSFAHTIKGAKDYAYSVAISGAASALTQANAALSEALEWKALSSM